MGHKKTPPVLAFPWKVEPNTGGPESEKPSVSPTRRQLSLALAACLRGRALISKPQGDGMATHNPKPTEKKLDLLVESHEARQYDEQEHLIALRPLIMCGIP